MKTCTRCGVIKPQALFGKRLASPDGLTAACRECLNGQKRADYALNPEPQKQKTKRNQARRFARDPAYKAAFDSWANVRRRGYLAHRPKWVRMTDFIPFFKKLQRLKKKRPGIELHVDHVIPLRHLLVCGLHVPANLQVLTHEQHVEKTRDDRFRTSF